MVQKAIISAPTKLQKALTFLKQRSPAEKAAIALLLAALIYAITFLLDAPTPWDAKVEKDRLGGESQRVRAHAATGHWWAALASIPILITTLLLTPIWTRPKKTNPLSQTKKPNSQQQHLIFWIGLTLITLAATWQRTPRLDHSFWNDEEFAARRYTAGEFKADSPHAPFIYKPVTPEKSLYLNRTGNNHLLHTLTARLTPGTQATPATSPRPNAPLYPKINERPHRIVPLAAAAATIILTGILTLRLTHTIPLALTAAALLALSPWHIRYSTEARGYSLLLLFVTLGILCLIHALDTRKRHWFLAWGACQAGMILSFMAALYVPLVANLTAGLILLKRKHYRSLLHLILATLLAALAALPLLAPSIPQLLEYLARTDQGHIEPPLTAVLHDLWSHLTLGLAAHPYDPALAAGPTLPSRLAASPLTWPLTYIILPLLTLAGLARLLKIKPATGTLLATATLGAATIALIHNRLTDATFHLWYLLYLLPGFAILLPLALTWLPKRTPWLSHTLAPALLLGTYGLFTAEAREAHRTIDRQPISQTIHFFRAAHPEAVSATFGVSDRQSKTYDPSRILLSTPADLDAAITRARTEYNPLYIYFCGRAETQARRPELYHALTTSPDFRHIKTIPAFEPLFTYEVYRLNSAPEDP